VELVIEGAGASPQLQQSGTPTGWQGRLLVPNASVLRNGPQRLSMPELGFQSVSFDGAGTSFTLNIEAAPGVNLGRPVVSSDGRDLILSFAAPVPQARLQVNRLDLSQPGAVPLPTYAPPLQPRAVAPPLGDMAVGSMMLRSPGYLNVSGPPVTMTLRNAPARDALMALAQLGGYGFAYVEGTTSDPAASLGARPISVAFRNESYSTAINTTLLSAGLQGRREGNVIFAGPNALGAGIGPQVSKVYRLNQVGPNAAADYLANLGATITKTDTIRTSVTQGISGSDAVVGGGAGQTTQTNTLTQVQEFGASRGPLVGLRGTTDTRLNTITIVGAPDLVSVAEQYLKQLDLRQRQVALNVRILDFNLNNVRDISNSFAIRWGNNFIINDAGQLAGAFGDFLPPRVTAGTPPLDRPEISPFPPRENPGTDYPKDNFFGYLAAQIQSGNSKLLASPTLILQENPAELRDAGTSSTGGSQEADGLDEYSIDSPIGRRRANEAVVRVGTNVPTSVESTVNDGGSVSCTIDELTTAGLVLGARIERIDDNGFVTFTLSPSVSAVVDEVPAGENCPPIAILNVRRLDTGALRVRDGQTLVLTGVISDFDRQTVSKWPILGDIPLIGQFFRSTNSEKEKRELVIMVTPRIIDDDQGGIFGYGIQPSPDAVRMLQNQ
jgi:type IV pilus assembly protein PilQ